MSLLLLLTSCLPVLTSARVNVMLIGATGDLANKYLLPAFFDKMITDESLYLIPAATRDEKAGQEYINQALAKMKCYEDLENENNKFGTCDEQKARVKKRVAPYKQIDVSNEEHWKGLAKLISSNDAGTKKMRGNAEKAATADEETGRLIYLAIPPHFVDVSSDFINKHLRPHTEHPGEGAWLRVVIEKPFGLNREQAVEMAEYVYERLSKHEVYRNDHILSKPALKAIRDLHTLNPGFEDRLHKDELARVEVGMYEKADVSDDPIYYNEYGVIRDVMQSHVTELAIAVAMFSDPNAPVSDEGKKSHRDTKSETLAHMRAGESDQLYVAQYAGYNEEVLESLSEEEKVNKTQISQTPTYAFVTMYFDHDDRWEDVPFLLTAGKKMPENKVFVRYVFKDQAYIEIIVANDDVGATIKVSEGPHFSADFIPADKLKGWHEWVDEGDNDHSPVERVLTLTGKNDDNPYASVLENVLKGDSTKFVDDEDLAKSWDVWTAVLTNIHAAYGGNHSATLPVYHEGHMAVMDGETLTVDPMLPGHELTSHDLTDMDFMIGNVFPKGNFGDANTEEEGEYDEESMFVHEDL